METIVVIHDEEQAMTYRNGFLLILPLFISIERSWAESVDGRADDRIQEAKRRTIARIALIAETSEGLRSLHRPCAWEGEWGRVGEGE